MIKRFIISIILLSIWIIMTTLQVIKSDISLTVLSRVNKTDIFKNNKSRELIKNEVKSGEFMATNNNLGMIVIRFNTHGKSVNDQFIFKIKEKDSPKWHYSSVINTDQITDDSFFPLGFPIINNSRNKIYIVELGSLYGDKNNHISFSNNFPMFISRYQYDKSRIKSDYKYFIEFIIGKSLSIVNSKEQIYSSLFYLIPLALYILWEFIIKKYLPINIIHFHNKDLKPIGNSNILIYLFLLFINVFFIKHIIFPLEILLICIWIILVKYYRISFHPTFLIASFFYFISFFSDNSIFPWSIEKNMLYAQVLILIGAFQFIILKFVKK